MDTGGYEPKGEGQVGQGDSPVVVRLEFPAGSGGGENDSLTREDEDIIGILCGIEDGHTEYVRWELSR